MHGDRLRPHRQQPFREELRLIAADLAERRIPLPSPRGDRELPRIEVRRPVADEIEDPLGWYFRYSAIPGPFPCARSGAKDSTSSRRHTRPEERLASGAGNAPRSR